jgi:surface polysaccharide O-acyltransferase-like enzyme
MMGEQTNSQNTVVTNKKQRQSGIELLRILAAMGVVVLHYNNPMIGGGLTYAKGINSALLYLLEALFVCAVNLFVLINGYFDINHQSRDLIKPLRLIVEVIFFNEAFYLLHFIIGGGYRAISKDTGC